MRSLLATTMMLLMMTAALAGCAGSDVTQDDVKTQELTMKDMPRELQIQHQSVLWTQLYDRGIYEMWS